MQSKRLKRPVVVKGRCRCGTSRHCLLLIAGNMVDDVVGTCEDSYVAGRGVVADNWGLGGWGWGEGDMVVIDGKGDLFIFLSSYAALRFQ